MEHPDEIQDPRPVYELSDLRRVRASLHHVSPSTPVRPVTPLRVVDGIIDPPSDPSSESECDEPIIRPVVRPFYDIVSVSEYDEPADCPGYYYGSESESDEINRPTTAELYDEWEPVG